MTSMLALLLLGFMLGIRHAADPDHVIAVTIAAAALAVRLGAGATGVTLMVDSGLKYLSTDVYRSAGTPASDAP